MLESAMETVGAQKNTRLREAALAKRRDIYTNMFDEKTYKHVEYYKDRARAPHRNTLDNR